MTEWMNRTKWQNEQNGQNQRNEWNEWNDRMNKLPNEWIERNDKMNKIKEINEWMKWQNEQIEWNE